MDHVAFLKHKYIRKILDEHKIIESRWSNNTGAPYKKIKINDSIYFKESGGKVLVKAKVQKRLFFSDLNIKKNKELFDKFNDKIKAESSYFNNIKNRKYCTLVFLKNVNKIAPFNIKRSYGVAWIVVKDIDELKNR